MHGHTARGLKHNGRPHGTLGFNKGALVLFANSTSECTAMD